MTRMIHVRLMLLVAAVVALTLGVSQGSSKAQNDENAIKIPGRSLEVDEDNCEVVDIIILAGDGMTAGIRPTYLCGTTIETPEPQDRFQEEVVTEKMGDMVYFVRAMDFPPLIERFNASSKEFLEPILLAQNFVTAFAVDKEKVWVAFGPVCFGYDLVTGKPSSSYSTDGNYIVGFEVDGDLLFINDSGENTTHFISINRTTMETIETRYLPDVTMGAGTQISPLHKMIFWRRGGSSSSYGEILSLSYSEEGEMSDINGRSVYKFADANWVWLSPDESLVVDDSGNIYSPSLEHVATTLSRVKDLDWHRKNSNQSTPTLVVLEEEQSRLTAYNEMFLPIGSVDLNYDPVSIKVVGDTVMTFTKTSRGIKVEEVRLSSLKQPEPVGPVNTNGLAYTPDSVFLDKNGSKVFLFSEEHASIFVWNMNNQSYQNTIPLVPAMANETIFVTYSGETNEIYTLTGIKGEMSGVWPRQEAGLLQKIDLSSSSLLQEPVAIVPGLPTVLTTAGSFLVAGWRFVRNTQEAFATIFPNNGKVADTEYLSMNSGLDYAWSETNQKLYWVDYWNELDHIKVGPDGEWGQAMSAEDDPDPYYPPTRVSPDGSIVISSTGAIKNGTTLDKLEGGVDPFIDAVFVDNGLVLMKDVGGDTRLEIWSEDTRWASGTVATSKTAPQYAAGEKASELPGKPHRLLLADDSATLVAIVLSGDGDGVPTFYALDTELNVIDA